MSDLYHIILADLKARFGDKIWLSPKELEPLFKKSEGQQANMRCNGNFPLPVREFGHNVGVSIYHLAEWLAYGEVKEDEETPAPPAPPKRIASSKVKIPSKVKAKNYDHLLPYWQNSLTFQLELIDEIEIAARTDEKTEELIFSKEDLQDWRKRIELQYGQIAQIEKQILIGELEGIEFPETPWTTL